MMSDTPSIPANTPVPTEPAIDPIEVELEQARKRLTLLQASFAEQYIIDQNGRQAAERAGCKCNSDGSFANSAYEFLINPDVQTYIELLQKQRRGFTRFTADKFLEMLIEEATADTAQLYDEDGQLKPIHEWPMAFRRGLVTGIENETIYKRVGDETRDYGRIAKIKINNRDKIKEMIGRHIGVQAFKDNVGLTGAVLVAHTVDVSKASESQLEALANLPLLDK